MPGLDALGIDFAAVISELRPTPLRALSTAARSEDHCEQCGAALRTSDRALYCEGCQVIYNDNYEARAHSDEPGPNAIPQGRLRMNGKGAGYYQMLLDQSSPGDNGETRVAATRDELLRWNQEFAADEGAAFPDGILGTVSEKFYRIQRAGIVLRDNRRRVVLAALLFHTCIHQGCYRSISEIARFAKLQCPGIAEGVKILRRLAREKQIDFGLDFNKDVKMSLATTLFASLEEEGVFLDHGVDEDHATRLKDATIAVCEMIEKNRIGRCFVRTMVISVAYGVLCRTADPRPPGRPVRLELSRFAALADIGDQTIRTALKTYSAYHKRFVPLYAAFGLETAKTLPA